MTTTTQIERYWNLVLVLAMALMLGSYAGWAFAQHQRTSEGRPSLLVEGRLSAKGAKPIQSITVRIMPEEVFFNQEGSVYISSRSESSCVAWVDQAAVAGRKAAGRDVLQAAFDECGKTFE